MTPAEKLAEVLGDLITEDRAGRDLDRVVAALDRIAAALEAMATVPAAGAVAEPQTVELATVEISPLFVAIYPDAAQALGGISRSSMYELIASGQIESCRIAGRRMIPVDALRAYAERVRVQAPDAA